MKLDNHDERIRYFELLLQRDLEQIPHYELPEGYKFVMYKEEDPSRAGWLHWVAIRREEQGKGLSKPLITYVMEIMRRLGYHHAKIPTQTTTWLACKVYMDLGFKPIPENKINSREGWRIIKTLTDHPVLCDLDEVMVDEILNCS